MIDDKPGAERLAHAILADITLYNDERIRTSHDLKADLATEIAEGRALFEARVESTLHGVFDEELFVWQGTAKDRANKLGGASIDRTRMLFALAAGVALVVVIVWLVTHSVTASN